MTIVHPHNPRDHDVLCPFCKMKGKHHHQCQYAHMAEMTPEEVTAKQVREQLEKDQVPDKFAEAGKKGLKHFRVG
jgi:hypothetical protein